MGQNFDPKISMVVDAITNYAIEPALEGVKNSLRVVRRLIDLRK